MQAAAEAGKCGDTTDDAEQRGQPLDCCPVAGMIQWLEKSCLGTAAAAAVAVAGMFDRVDVAGQDAETAS